MPLPFLKSGTKQRDHIVAIDLGTRATKAVYIQRKGESIVLNRFALLDAPIYDKTISVELLGEHLKAVSQALEARTKEVILSVGVGDSMVRFAELPMIPVSDMRQMLKFNTKNYLQEELTDHAFDCYVLPPRPGPKPGESTRPVAMTQKQRVLVGGMRQRVLDDLTSASKAAGLVPTHVMPGVIGSVNALEFAQPQTFLKEVVALVDIGFRNSTINILDAGDLILSRVVGLGGDKLTNGLAETLSISYVEAEGIKVGMPAEVQSTIEPLLLPLGRELRASIDFFEHQQDKAVSQILISGGSARSDLIAQILQTELMAGSCKTWNPLTSFQLGLSPQQMGEVEQVAPQFTVAVGAAAILF